MRAPFECWEDLKRRMLVRFRPSQDGMLHEQFLAIRQEGNVAEYRRNFELLLGPLQGLSMEVLESTFVKGLRHEVKAELRLMRPNGLGQIMELAQLIKDKNNIVHDITERLCPKFSKGFMGQAGKISEAFPARGTLNHGKTSENFQTRMVAISDRSSGQRREPQSKRLSKSKSQARRAKGLCFKCDEKFTIGHQCKNRELRVLLVFDNEVEEEGQRMDEGQMEESHLEVAETVELSLNSVVGLTTPGTMKLKGVIHGTEVTILINCGATHNFIGLNLVKDLQLPLEITTSYGDRGCCKGKRHLPWCCAHDAGAYDGSRFFTLGIG